MEQCDPARQLLAGKLRELEIKNFLEEKVCEEYESLVYKKLINYKDVNKAKYQHLKNKQLSIEQERKLEEEINSKLSGINSLLSKALTVNPDIFGEEENKENVVNECSIKVKKEEKQEFKLGNLFKEEPNRRVDEVQRQVKQRLKALHQKVSEIEQFENESKSKALHKLRGLRRNNTQISNVKQNKYEILDQSFQNVAQSLILSNYIQQALNSQTIQAYFDRIKGNENDVPQKFYDFYSLWIVKKIIMTKQNELKEKVQSLVKTKFIETQSSIIQSTFGFQQTLQTRQGLSKTPNQFLEEVVSVRESELLLLGKDELKMIKSKFHLEQAANENSSVEMKKLCQKLQKLQQTKQDEKLRCSKAIEIFYKIENQQLDSSLLSLFKDSARLQSKSDIPSLKEIIRVVGISQAKRGVKKLKYMLILCN